jgi:Ni,Fe-hydrogenase I cytochrome b subunit
MSESTPLSSGAHLAASVEFETGSTQLDSAVRPRHAALVRVTHWLFALCFLALLVTGLELVVSHPRFYWGESGNINTRPLFAFSIPSSRSTIENGYEYVLPDQNGWSRYLHFEAAWYAGI